MCITKVGVGWARWGVDGRKDGEGVGLCGFNGGRWGRG